MGLGSPLEALCLWCRVFRVALACSGRLSDVMDSRLSLHVWRLNPGDRHTSINECFMVAPGAIFIFRDVWMMGQWVGGLGKLNSDRTAWPAMLNAEQAPSMKLVVRIHIQKESKVRHHKLARSRIEMTCFMRGCSRSIRTTDPLKSRIGDFSWGLSFIYGRSKSTTGIKICLNQSSGMPDPFYNLPKLTAIP